MTPENKPTGGSVRAIVGLLVDVERRLGAGPWDHWDEEVLTQWRTIAQNRLNEACLEIDRELREPYDVRLPDEQVRPL